MNDLGVSIIWLAAQVTVVCGVLLVLSVLLRGRHQTTVSPTLTGLVLVVGLTAICFSPWPRWSWDHTEVADTAGTNNNVIIDQQTSLLPESENSPGTDGALRKKVNTDSVVAAAWTAFLERAKRDLGSAAPHKTATGLRWTGWVAICVLALIAIGTIRLLAGWYSVHRCLRRSISIEDLSVEAILEELCAEMTCSRKVALYESSELTSAATVGWMKPVILLPLSWRSWSDAERRMVLAHELAHVTSGDAATWMAAQVGLMLHFYHPFVHWLVGRLRLELELAADARAASVTGGAQSYLITLAELAVRQPERAVAWPAPAFLPTRGTLLRRIEMLRDSRPSAERSSAWRRRIVIAATLVTAFLVAGIRRPGATEAVAQPTATATQSSEFNLENVPQSTILLMGIRPSELAGRNELKTLVNFIEDSIESSETGISLQNIDQFLLMGSPPEIEGARGGLGRPLMELRMTGPADFSKYLETHFGATTEQTVDGVKLYASADVNQSPQAEAAHLLNDRTLLSGSARNLARLINDKRKNVGGPDWHSKVSALRSSQFVFVHDVMATRPEVEQAFRRNPNPMVGMISPLWQNTDLTIGSATFGEEMTLNVNGWATDEAGAAKVKQTLEMLMPMVGGWLEGAKASMQNAPAGREKMQKLALESITLAQNALKTAKLDQIEDQVSLKLSGNGLSLGVMAGMMLPAVQAAREAARRTQGMNNMKQIGLALHNYHDANGSFPPAVLFGPDGKTKYSWRVAILPFLEQQELYDQYRRTEPWDSDHNRKLLKSIPPTLHSPNAVPGTANASYFAFVGEHTGFGNTPGTGTEIRGFLDGLSNTLMVVEAKRDIPWTKPEDISYSADEPLPKLGGFHGAGFMALVADGSVRYLMDIEETLLRNMITRDDGNPIQFP